MLQRLVSDVSHLPDPSSEPGVWFALMKCDKRAWNEIVDKLFFFDSLCDRRAVEIDPTVATFACQICDDKPCFVTNKGLLQHMRTKHALRVPARRFVDSSAACMFCGTQFRQRLRCIAHMSDSRRPCFHRMMATEPPLSDAVACSLDEFDRAARRHARRDGHTHPIAVGPAITSDGKKIGFARK